MKRCICPEDNCEAKVAAELKKAEQSIYFMTFSFTSDTLGDILVAKNGEGVLVQGIFEKSQISEYSEYEKLKNAGIAVKTDKNKNNMHHKVFIIDRKIVITGSYNPTMSGTERNDENIIIIYDEGIAKQYLDEFNLLY